MIPTFPTFYDKHDISQSFSPFARIFFAWIWVWMGTRDYAASDWRNLAGCREHSMALDCRRDKGSPLFGTGWGCSGCCCCVCVCVVLYFYGMWYVEILKSMGRKTPACLPAFSSSSSRYDTHPKSLGGLGIGENRQGGGGGELLMIPTNHLYKNGGVI